MAKRIGFAGLGLMGSRMARNLAQKGFEVHGWNRSPQPLTALAADGVRAAATPRALAEAVDVLCTCVADPAALHEVALGPQGFIEGARAGQLLIDFSTVSVELVQLLGERFAAKQVEVIDAPVTGSKGGAEKGTLVIMAGGTLEAMARAQEVFSAVGDKVIHCGALGTGTQVKLAGNVMIAAMLQALSEAMLLTSKAGVDPRKLLEVVAASGFRSPYFDFKGQAMLARDFSTHFAIDLMHKDLSLFVASAAKHRVPTPLAACSTEIYNLARAAGKGTQDISAVVTAFEALCGHQL